MNIKRKKINKIFYPIFLFLLEILLAIRINNNENPRIMHIFIINGLNVSILNTSNSFIKSFVLT